MFKDFQKYLNFLPLPDLNNFNSHKIFYKVNKSDSLYEKEPQEFHETFSNLNYSPLT